MANTTDNPSPSGAVPMRKRKAKPATARVKNAWLIAGIILVFTAGMIWSGWAGSLLKYLYEPLPIIVIVILMIEYILLKGRDRSRIYKIELEKMRKKRAGDIEFMRNLERDLQGLRDNIDSLIESSPQESPAAGGNLQDLRDRLERLRKDLSRNL